MTIYEAARQSVEKLEDTVMFAQRIIQDYEQQKQTGGSAPVQTTGVLVNDFEQRLDNGIETLADQWDLADQTVSDLEYRSQIMVLDNQLPEHPQRVINQYDCLRQDLEEISAYLRSQADIELRRYRDRSGDQYW